MLGLEPHLTPIFTLAERVFLCIGGLGGAAILGINRERVVGAGSLWPTLTVVVACIVGVVFAALVAASLLSFHYELKKRQPDSWKWVGLFTTTAIIACIFVMGGVFAAIKAAFPSTDTNVSAPAPTQQCPTAAVTPAANGPKPITQIPADASLQRQTMLEQQEQAVTMPAQAPHADPAPAPAHPAAMPTGSAK